MHCSLRKKKKREERKTGFGSRAPSPGWTEFGQITAGGFGKLRERFAALPHATCPAYCFESNYVKLEMKYSERFTRRGGCMQVSGISSSRGNSMTIVTPPACLPSLRFCGADLCVPGIRA